MFQGSLLKRLGPSAAAVAILFACLSPGLLVESLLRPMRSVQRCDPRSEHVRAFVTERDCEIHCQKTYTKKSPQMWIANEHLAQNHVRQVKGTNPTNGKPAHWTECCCIFETPWPTFVVPSAIGRRPEDEMVKKPSECYPILISVNLEERTKQSYNLLCRYLNKHEPQTMLELMQLAEAAAYLNLMRPKHPAIALLLRKKKVNRIDKVAVGELKAVFYTDLLDVYIPLENYDGYALKTTRFRRFLKLKSELNSALKSEIIERAFDELVTSNMLVDAAAAAKYLSELGKDLGVPVHLLAGHYDKYDDDLTEYFTLPGIDCKTLASVNMRLQTYLAVFKTLSESLHQQKLVYQQMSQRVKSGHLISVLEMQKVFLNLYKVNCQTTSQRG